MHRIYIPDDRMDMERVELDREESRQLRSVLRAVPGMAVELFNGCGKTRLGQVAEVGKNRLSVTGGTVEYHPRTGTDIVLAQCLVKGKRMDWIVEKAVELGVREIVPIISDRTVVRLNEKEAVSRVQRWERIAIEAARQCQTPWLPLICRLQSLSGALEVIQCEWKAIATLAAADARLLKKALNHQPSSAAMLIGPEGDFSPDEVEAARQRGWSPVSFGKSVLRTETASLYALSAMHCTWQTAGRAEE